MRRFTTTEVAEISGASYRQLDYWCRLGVLSPENNGAGSGGGRIRLWTADEVAVVSVILELSALGATSEIWTIVAASLSVPVQLWPESILVTADGRVYPDGGRRTGWFVDLAEIRSFTAAAVGDLVGS